MSLDAIKKVAEAEVKADEIKLEQQAAAKKLLADIEKAGRESLEQVKLEAKAEAARLAALSDEEAETASHKISDEVFAECAELKKNAMARMKQAQELIVERVVNR